MHAAFPSVPAVFAVIPVFNRLALTRKCVRLLLAQTYRPLYVVVADGGSTDGTPEKIKDEFPDVTVLRAPEELWWAGAMAMGIDHVLNASGAAGDFVLMMNNDTEFDADFVTVLVRTSIERHAAVGALTVDIRDPSVILDAGEFIHWDNYTFPVKTAVEPGERFYDGVDVLPGRGTIVPLSMIRKAGNIDFRRFPHYIADYEFFARVKRHGFRLGVTYETTLKSDPTVTGLAAQQGTRSSILEAVRLQLSRRSMNNFLDHYRFIEAAAPASIKGRVKRRFLVGLAIRVLDRFKIMSALRALRLALRGLFWLALPPYSVSRADLVKAGLDPVALTLQGALNPFVTSAGVQYSLSVSEKRAQSFGEGLARLYMTAGIGQRRISRAVIWKAVTASIYWKIFPVYHVSREECFAHGLDPELLLETGVLREDEIPGFYVFSLKSWKISRQGLAAEALYAYARANRTECRKARRLRMAAI